MRTRYKFTGRADGIYYWESVSPVGAGDSRHEQVICTARWFWNHGIHASDGPHWCTGCGQLRALVRELFPERYGKGM